MKIKIWGIGNSQQNLFKIIRKRNIDIEALTDSFTETNSTLNFMGAEYKICPPEVWYDLKCDYAVICACGFENEIKEKILKNNSSETVLSVNEFYKILYNDYYGGENDLWNFFIEGEHRKIIKLCHYFKVYDKWFSKFRNTDVIICEIGVANGGSLQMWKNYFGKNATIIGIDIDERCKEFTEEQINIEIGSQEDRGFWNYIKEKYPRIDILLDDGGHTMSQQKVTFESMYNHISEGGIYLCEDVHTSYWKEYGGGYKCNDSFIEYSKNFVDNINAFHIREDIEKSEYTYNMGGIHYYDSMIVIEKESLIGAPSTIII